MVFRSIRFGVAASAIPDILNDLREPVRVPLSVSINGRLIAAVSFADGRRSEGMTSKNVFASALHPLVETPGKLPMAVF